MLQYISLENISVLIDYLKNRPKEDITTSCVTIYGKDRQGVYTGIDGLAFSFKYAEWTNIEA